MGDGQIDLKNAYNEACRAETIQVSESEPSLSHLAALAAVTLAPYSGNKADLFEAFSVGELQ